jgi:hypothetical protein
MARERARIEQPGAHAAASRVVVARALQHFHEHVVQQVLRLALLAQDAHEHPVDHVAVGVVQAGQGLAVSARDAPERLGLA